MHANTDAAPHAPLLGARTPRGEALPVGEHQALVESLLEVSAVIDVAARRPVRHLRGANKIAPAQFDGVNAHLPCRLVDEALEHEARFRLTRPAIDRELR